VYSNRSGIRQWQRGNDACLSSLSISSTVRPSASMSPILSLTLRPYRAVTHAPHTAAVAAMTAGPSTITNSGSGYRATADVWNRLDVGLSSFRPYP
jgi:hypothetical protein